MNRATKDQLPGRWANGGERIDTTNVRFLPLHRVVERTELDLDVAPRTDDSYPDVPEQPSLALRLFDAFCWFVAAVVLVAVIYSIDVIDFMMQPHS